MSGPRIRDVLAKTLDAGAPVVAFLVADGVAGTTAGAAAAVGTALLLAAYRLLRGDDVRLVALALVVILVYAAVAETTGQGRDFFLPDLVINAVAAAVFAGSIAVRRPITGAVAQWAGWEERDWHRVAARRRLHLRLTLLWVGLWVLHLLVLLPLYAAGAVVALGVATLILGKPAVLLLAVLTWRFLRRSGTTLAAAPLVASSQQKEIPS